MKDSNKNDPSLGLVVMAWLFGTLALTVGLCVNFGFGWASIAFGVEHLWIALGAAVFHVEQVRKPTAESTGSTSRVKTPTTDAHTN